MAIVFILDAQGVPVARLVGKNLAVVGSRDTQTATGTAASLATYAGNGQSGVVGTALAIPPAVRVTDANGNPVAGSTVTWAPGGGSGTTSTGNTSTSNANGVATVGSWSMGTTAGSTYTLFAYSGNLTNSPIGFSVVPVAGTATALAISGGTSQSTTPTGTMPSRLTAKATDTYGNPVSGVTLVVTTTDANGTLGDSLVTTNSSGLAGTTYAAGTSASTASVVMALPSGTSVGFAMTTVAGPAAQLQIIAGDGQVGLAGASLANPVVVSVDDGYGNQVGSGSTVQFVVVQGGGSLSRATATPVNSQSSVTWVMGSTAGQNALEISLANVSGSTVTAFASGTNPTADTVFVVSGTGQSATVGQALTTPIRWGVTGSGSSASGQIVDLAVTGDASLSTTRTVSSTSGLVSITVTAGTVPSRYTVTLSAGTLSGSPSAVTFDAVAGSATKLVVSTQPESNPTPGVAWNTQPVVVSTDTYGNLVSTNTRVQAVLLSGDGTLGSDVSTFAVASGATATFSGLSYTQTSVSSFQIAFRCNSLSTATASVQTAQPPFASQLAFTAQPVNGTTGIGMSTVVVAVQDSNGNTVTGSSAPVSMAIGSQPGGATLSGTTMVNASSGVASFTNLSLNVDGTYTLAASSPGLSGATSASFTQSTPSGGSYPNEPAGFTQVALRQWTSATENGWTTPTGGTLKNDGVGLPTGLSTYILHNVPQGTTGSYSMGITEKVISSLNKTRLYASVWFKISPEFQGHDTNTNKLALWLPAGVNGNSFFLNMKGKGEGQLGAEAYFQGVPPALNGGSTSRRILSSTGLSAKAISRDSWHQWELDYTLNTYDVADGVLKMWFNGVQFINETNIGVRGTGGEANSPFWRVKWNPYWGGGSASSNTHVTQIQCAEIYVSG